MEDRTFEVVGEVGQGQFGFGPLDPDGPDEQAVAVVLVGKDMLDSGADRGLLRIGAGRGLGHRLASGLAPVDSAGNYDRTHLKFALYVGRDGKIVDQFRPPRGYGPSEVAISGDGRMAIMTAFNDSRIFLVD